LTTVLRVLKLRVAVGMRGALLGLDVGLQAEPHGAQQIADHRAVRAMPALKQRICEVTHAAADPQQRRLGISARGVLHQRAQIVEQLGVLDDLGGATATRPTDPIAALQLLIIQIGDTGSDRLVRQPGHAVHRLDPAATDRACLGCRPDPSQPLVEKRCQRREACLKRGFVDHTSGFQQGDIIPPSPGTLFADEP
jgi:hypothetical protein